MKRNNGNPREYLKNQLLALKGAFLVLLIAIVGLLISVYILKIEDAKACVTALKIHICAQLIAIIAALVYSYRNQKRMIRDGIHIFDAFGWTVTLALVLEAIFMLCNVGALMDMIKSR